MQVVNLSNDNLSKNTSNSNTSNFFLPYFEEENNPKKANNFSENFSANTSTNLSNSS
jgi:hypothetical protein